MLTKRYKWIVGTIIGIIMFMVIVVSMINPLRHSMGYMEFQRILVEDILDNCQLSLRGLLSIEFDEQRFSIWERYYLLGRQYFPGRPRVISGRNEFFSERYVLANSQKSLPLIISGINNRVCLITVEPPLKDTTLDQKCLEIVEQRFKNMVK